MLRAMKMKIARSAGRQALAPFEDEIPKSRPLQAQFGRCAEAVFL
jgi:hypothetical protein